MFNTADGMPREEGNVDEAQVMNIMQDRSPETLQAMAEQEGAEEANMEQAQNSFLSPELDQPPTPEVEEII